LVQNDARYNLKIVDTGRPDPGPRSNRTTSSDDVDVDEPVNGDDDLAEGVDEEATEDHSSSIDRTRQELAELDDLDV
jgi:hypothetical protein